MGTVGHNAVRDNWFFSDGALDNQAWDTALAVAATGRITQLTAYMAGDLAAIHGGPALWDAAGNLLLYAEQPIARRSAPYSGGFDGTGRNQNDGYYINVYGFNHTFTNPTSFIVGAFRRSGDSWILGFNDHESNYGHLKTVGGSTPGTATGGNSWSSQSGFNGGVQAYATYVPLGIFSRVGGTFVPVSLKRFFDSVTTYFHEVMVDTPLNYYRMDTLGGVADFGSYGLDAIQNGGPQLDSGLIVDPDQAMEFDIAGDFDGLYTQRPVQKGPLNIAIEAWVKPTGVGRAVTGFGDSAGIWESQSPVGPEQGQVFRIVNGTDLYYSISSWIFGAGLEAGYTGTVPGVLTIGTTHHVVFKYLAGPDFAGDGAGLAGNAEFSIYVDNVRVLHVTGLASFRPFMDTWPTWGSPFYTSIGNIPDGVHGPGGTVGWSAQAVLDEVAFYGNDVIGGDPLPPARITVHYNTGLGVTGGIISTSGQIFVRNDANSAWIALNMAALRQEMPERREFPGRIVYPDGRWEDVLMRWGEPETFGFTKGAWQQARSGLVVPRQFALA